MRRSGGRPEGIWLALGLLLFPPFLVGVFVADKRSQERPAIAVVEHLTGAPAEIRSNTRVRTPQGYASPYRRSLCALAGGRTYVVRIGKRLAHRGALVREWRVDAVGPSRC